MFSIDHAYDSNYWFDLYLNFFGRYKVRSIWDNSP